MIPFSQFALAAVMAQRRIGQEAFYFSAKPGRQTNLDALLALIDCVPAARALSSLSKAPKGEKAWPPLAMFRALLLATSEKIFGTWQRGYRLRAMRWLGLAKARLQINLAAIADNNKTLFPAASRLMES